MGIVLKNAAYVITQDSNRSKLRNRDILIENGKIAAIGSGLDGEEKVDCSRMAIMPGLINTHTHVSMALFRGVGDDMDLQSWLQNRIFPIESKLTEDDVYWGAVLGIIEMLESGTTTFVDMYHYEYAVGKACNELGMRGCLSHVLFDFPAVSARDLEHGLKQTLRIGHTDLVTPAVAPHSIYLCSKSTLERCKQFAQQNNLLLHMHISETKKEVEDCVEKNGVKPIEYLEKINFLGHDVMLAHGVWLSKEECMLLTKMGCSILHSPTSNMKLASGVSPIHHLISAGVNVSLGTDGAVSNNNLDMFESMKFAALLQKVDKCNPTIMDAQQVLDMATINGAKAMHRSDLGSIEVGKTADIIGVSLDSTRMRPHTDIVSHLVYSANGADVKLVLVNGNIRVKDGQFAGEREKLLNKVEKQSKDLLKKAGL